MRRLGKLVIMTAQEHEALEKGYQYEQDSNMARGLRISELIYANRDLSAAVVQMRDISRAEGKAAFTAGKFHSAGGYAHALMIYRAELQLFKNVSRDYKALIDYWRPFIAALETVPGCLMRIDDWSDNMAPADFEAVGVAVATERRQP